VGYLVLALLVIGINVGIGFLFAALLAVFGVVVPWWVGSVGLILLGFVGRALRGK
jgi:hypothetical protein